uniref:Ig-like domain-containing protein n=1 Tax=Dicentrarchus labrax TaxID=13489 RepID=A0A8P4GCU4_DICLA
MCTHTSDTGPKLHQYKVYSYRKKKLETDSAIFCSPKPATAEHCEDVTLQCHLDPPQDATNMMVEWRHGHNNDIVHLYRDRKDNPAEQKEPFEGRTSLFREGLTKGNLSLKLSTVALSDAGRYRCSIHTDKLQKSCYVNLTVESKVIGSHDPVTVRVGYDVILPCHLEPPFDVRTLTWRHGHNNDIVHLYRDRKDNPAEQKEPFEGRTSLFREGLTKGNLSLKLSTVALSDAGRYRCSIHTDKLQKSCYVNLTVVLISSPDCVVLKVYPLYSLNLLSIM